MPAAARVGDEPPSATATKAARIERPLVRRASCRSVVALETCDPVRRGQREATRRELFGAPQQGAADHAVLDDVAKRVGADRPMVVVHGQRRVRFADPNVEDRLSFGHQMPPEADRLEQAPRALRDRRDATVERRRGGRDHRSLFDQHDPQPGAGSRTGQCQAGHTAADDQQIKLRPVDVHRAKSGRDRPGSPVRHAVAASRPRKRGSPLLPDGWRAAGVWSKFGHHAERIRAGPPVPRVAIPTGALYRLSEPGRDSSSWLAFCNAAGSPRPPGAERAGALQVALCSGPAHGQAGPRSGPPGRRMAPRGSLFLRG